MTLLTIGSACRNNPRKERSCGVAGTMSFITAISLCKRNDVDLRGRLDDGQALLPWVRGAFACQHVIEENASETGATQDRKVEELDEGLAAGDRTHLDGKPSGRDAVRIMCEKIERQLSPFWLSMRK
jgi:hypothetical protein